MNKYVTKPQTPASSHPADNTLAAWLAWFVALPAPVILLEGTRDLPDDDRAKLAALAEHLARSLPNALFRSGNAPGSDEAFAAGVARADPRRLQLVLPYAGHRKQMIPGGAYPVSLSQLGDREAHEVAEATQTASPQHADLLAKRGANPKLAAKSAYLLRDTFKVLGDSRLDLSPATAALFYVNTRDPGAGGTGHTLRVCQQNGIPLLDQRVWLTWPCLQKPSNDLSGESMHFKG